MSTGADNEYWCRVEAALLLRAEEFLRKWLPAGDLKKEEYRCGDVEGHPGKSFSFNIAKGTWADFAATGIQGQSGKGIISLHMAIFKKTRQQSCRELAPLSGIKRPRRTKEEIADIVCPVPDSMYECGSDGRPVVPKIPETEDVTSYFPYTDTEGRLLRFTLRWDKPDGKDIRPLVCVRYKNSGQLGWQLRDITKDAPLYNQLGYSPQITKVLIVEGEKAADAAQEMCPDRWVTTWPGGVNRVSHADWTLVKSLESASYLLWPDNDDEGRRAMNEVMGILGRGVEMLQIPRSWAKGWDAADAKAEKWDRREFEEFRKSAALWIAENKRGISRPRVDLTGTDLAEQTELIFAALKEFPDVFVKGREMVRLLRDDDGVLDTEVLDSRKFRSFAGTRLSTYRINGKGITPVQIKEPLADCVVFNAPGVLKQLRRLVKTPIVTKDARLIDTPGYDKESGIYVDLPSDYNPNISQQEAKEAIDYFLKDFRFMEESDRTAAVAFPLSAICRDLIDGATPLARAEAPARGSGKTTLVRNLCRLIDPKVTELSYTESEEELRKVLTSEALMRSEVFMFDNAQKITSPILERFLTSDYWADRQLATNRIVKVPVRAVRAITVINAEMSPGMFRRCVRIGLDSDLENPEDRTDYSEANFDRHVLANRGRYLSAWTCLWRTAIERGVKINCLRGAWGPWRGVCIPILEANGFKGLMKTYAEDRDDVMDVETERLSNFVAQIAKEFGVGAINRITATRIADWVRTLAYAPIVPNRDGKITPEAIGQFLRNARRRRVNGFKIMYKRDRDASYYWLEGETQEEQQIVF